MVTSGPTTSRRRPTRLRWVLVAVLLTPVVELAVAVAVADLLGGGWTLLLLLTSTVVGALILVRGGPATFGRVREVSRQGRAPTGELADAFLTVLGGVLLLVPGLVTDVLGLLCLVPPFRWAAKAAVTALTARTVARAAARARSAGTVVQGAVVLDSEEHRPGRARSGEAGTSRPIEGRVLPSQPSPGQPPQDPGPGDANRPRPGG